ncbi:BgTH12-04148 [Blumeria graminis f. sp. triticale]|uniref:BgTH12-04148 n=1 Tax=Blumeria graminis f. sp. triticale TaxID=1689686 RepID=A0A9W4CWH4_BLUGR|nr:BgTH12-04148 [Blumeria graminis f. sp. triticale]
MKVASPLKNLALLSLITISSCEKYRAASKLYTQGPDDCAISPRAIVSDACASYTTLDNLNDRLRSIVVDITSNTDFFSHYRLVLFGKECPFWSDDDAMCGNAACAVSTLNDESQIPMIWRAEELGKLEGPRVVHPGSQLKDRKKVLNPLGGILGTHVRESCVIEDDEEYNDRDYCIREDETCGIKGDYVSLVDNPERFTGYSGDGARQIWDSIYRENCFSKSSFPRSNSLGYSSFTKQPAKNIFNSIPRKSGRKENKHLGSTRFSMESVFEYDNECLEKRVFYRIISGMHTSITSHICSEYLNQTSGEWGANPQCYKERLRDHPDRISNLYFNYALVLRAITKLGPSLKNYVFCSADASQNLLTKTKLQSLMNVVSTTPQIFDESLMFVNGEGPSLKQDFRHRFRNISRIMDCVGCDKCRLWGKLQIAGYGTALKVLFETDNNSNDVPQLKRTEIVALFNTLARISTSLEAIKNFKLAVEGRESELAKEKQDIILSQPRRKLYYDKLEILDPTIDGSDEEDKSDHLQRRRLPNNATIFEQLTVELDIFWRVMKYVIQSWFRFPGKLIRWQILKMEVPRAWDSYIGLPVKPRKWLFKKPILDEL